MTPAGDAHPRDAASPVRRTERRRRRRLARRGARRGVGDAARRICWIVTSCAPRCRRRWSSGPRTSRSSRRCSTSASRRRRSATPVTAADRIVLDDDRRRARARPGVGTLDGDLVGLAARCAARGGHRRAPLARRRSRRPLRGDGRDERRRAVLHPPGAAGARSRQPSRSPRWPKRARRAATWSRPS